MGDAAEPPRELVAGRELERVVEPGHGLVVEEAVGVRERARFGGLDQDVRIVGEQAGSACECRGRIAGAALRAVGPAQQPPAFGLLRRAFQFRLQLRDRVFHRCGWLRAAGIQRRRRADEQVEQPGADDETGADGRRVPAIRPPYRAQHDCGRDRRDRQRRDDEGDGHGRCVHHSCSRSSGTSARAPRGLRTSRYTANPPSSSTTPGPNQSSHVDGPTRGRYSTNSP